MILIRLVRLKREGTKARRREGTKARRHEGVKG